MAAKDKSIWILVIFILSGLVVGGLLGQLATNVSWLSWMSFGQEFGLREPLLLDLKVVQITFGLMFNINIASIIGMTIAIIIYKKFI